MRLLFTILLITLLTPVISAQILKGSITDMIGEPIPYSTVYIQDSNRAQHPIQKGIMRYSLPAGKYTVIYQSLGYCS